MDGNFVERELYRQEPDALEGFFSTIKSAITGGAKSAAGVAKGAVVEGGKAAVGSVAGRLAPKSSTSAGPAPTKAPSGLFIALGVVAVLGLVAYSKGKKRQ
jgi:hypothetical protein